MSLTAKDAESIEAKWSNPTQNIVGLTTHVKYRDTETEGSSEETVSEPVSIGEGTKVLSELTPNTIYRVETCICKAADNSGCACVANPQTAATKPLGMSYIVVFLLILS